MERRFIKKFDGGGLIFNRGVEIIFKKWGLEWGIATLEETIKLKKEIFIFVKNIALTKNKFVESIFHECFQPHLEN